MSERLLDITGGVIVGAAAVLLYKQYVAANQASSMYLRTIEGGELDTSASIHEAWNAPEKQPPPFPNDPHEDFVHLVVRLNTFLRLVTSDCLCPAAQPAFISTQHEILIFLCY
jgi:hypothetical protein